MKEVHPKLSAKYGKLLTRETDALRSQTACLICPVCREDGPEEKDAKMTELVCHLDALLHTDGPVRLSWMEGDLCKTEEIRDKQEKNRVLFQILCTCPPGREEAEAAFWQER